MAFNINTFRDSFNYLGEPASPALFEVNIYTTPYDYITSPSFKKTTTNPNTSTNDPEDAALADIVLPEDEVADNRFIDAGIFKLRCESCSIPKRSLITSTRNTYGVGRNIAIGSAFQELQLSFIATGNMFEHKFFIDWHNKIQDTDYYVFDMNSDIEYYTKYVGTVDVTQYDKSGNIVQLTTFNEAYPVEINEIPLGWNLTNDYIKVNVTMMYRNFVVEKEF